MTPDEQDDLLRQLREIREVLARLEKTLREIALGLGVTPDG